MMAIIVKNQKHWHSVRHWTLTCMLPIDNVYPTPPSNGYYVDPYPTMVYYTYTPYNNPYNNVHTTLVKNVGTNKHLVSGNLDLPKM